MGGVNTVKKTFVLFTVGFNKRSGLSELTKPNLIEIERCTSERTFCRTMNYWNISEGN